MYLGIVNIKELWFFLFGLSQNILQTARSKSLDIRLTIDHHSFVTVYTRKLLQRWYFQLYLNSWFFQPFQPLNFCSKTHQAALFLAPSQRLSNPAHLQFQSIRKTRFKLTFLLLTIHCSMWQFCKISSPHLSSGTKLAALFFNVHQIPLALNLKDQK